jgi:hypothetical protein
MMAAEVEVDAISTSANVVEVSTMALITPLSQSIQS